MRSAALSLAVLLGAASLVSLIVSLHYAELLADWSLPGLGALAAIGSNVMFMVAHKLKRQGR